MGAPPRRPTANNKHDLWGWLGCDAFWREVPVGASARLPFRLSWETTSSIRSWICQSLRTLDTPRSRNGELQLPVPRLLRRRWLPWTRVVVSQAAHQLHLTMEQLGELKMQDTRPQIFSARLSWTHLQLFPAESSRGETHQTTSRSSECNPLKLVVQIAAEAV